MKITRIIKSIVAAFALATAVPAFAGGDIYEILPCDRTGNTVDPYATFAKPLISGQTVYFKVRLASRTMNGPRWRLEHIGSNLEIVDDALYPLQLGIYVSGKREFATLVECKESAPNVTDLIFSYTTKVGDFALPIVLATVDESGDVVPATTGKASSKYYFNPMRTDKWKISNDAGETCELTYWTSPGAPYLPPVLAPASKDGKRSMDYSLSSCGFHIKTIDFDSNWEEKDSLWRSVHQDSTITVGVTPQIVATEALTQAVDMYVWSTDEEVIRIDGGTEVDLITDYQNGTAITKKTRVGKVTIAGGRRSQDFSIYGVKENSTKVNLVLSAWNNYTYDESKKLVSDYVTVPVKCIEPQPASVIVECDHETVYANAKYRTSVARLNVYVSQPCEKALDVTVTPKFEDGTSNDEWKNYVRFSTTDTVSALPSGDAMPTVRIPAGSTEKKSIYVYALRSDEHTVGEGHQIHFAPVITDEAKTEAGIQSLMPAGMWISAEKPIIVTPEASATYTVTASEKLEIPVAVDDTYADMTDKTIGYQVQIKTSAATNWVTLPETFKASGEGGTLVGLKSNAAPAIEYPSAGEQTSQIRVVSPISGKTSEVTTFTVNVAAAKTTRAYTTDDKDDTYIEGDIVHFTIELSGEHGQNKPVYAFLVCNEEVDLSMFGGTAAKAIILDSEKAAPTSVGRQISTVGTSATSSFTVLDGVAEGDGGQNYTFSIVLCDQKTYDPARRIGGFPTTEMLNITVYNKDPVINLVSVGGFDSEGNGYTYVNQYPKGQFQTIQPDISDVSYDLKHGFTYKWTASRGGKGIANGTVAHDSAVDKVTKDGNNILVPEGTDINTVPFEYNFPQSGDYTIKIQVMDKDMGGKYSPLTYSVNLSVIDNPQVQVKVEDSYVETDNKARVTVGLAYYESDEPLVVKVTVVPPEGANPGVLKLDEEYKAVPEGYADLADNEYYLTFNAAIDQQMLITEMDGTTLSSSKGFTLKAEVVSTGESIDPKKTWAEYYLPGSQKVYVENVAPVTVVTEPSTNAWEVAGGAATQYPIRWQIRSDVDADFTEKWERGEGPGIKVEFNGCDNATTFYVKDTDDWSGTFIPNFGMVQGHQVVTLTIEDKDGGYQTWSYAYEVTPSKFLTTIATGPSGGENSAITRKYALLGDDRLGQGHTWVDAMFTSAKNFSLLWNCSKAASANIFAYGYKVGANDNGTLNNGQDIAIDTTGAATAGETPANTYQYGDAEKDSFFYAWIVHAMGNDGQQTDSLLNNTIMPERPGRVGSATVALPNEKTPDGGYVDTKVEAIFSKEWLPSDNLGDINQDAIPDVFAMTDWGNGNLIALVAGGEEGGADIVENDLINLAGSNPDEDFLPRAFSVNAQGAAIVTAASYAPIGNAFTTQLEIRGFGRGLNARDVTTSDPEFDEVEEAAWRAYAAAHGHDPANRDLTVWSPEPQGRMGRMDPTVADTDGDGFPDGWEYFFWYSAHVWYPAAAPAATPLLGQNFVYERFNRNNIIAGIEIPALEVEARFNPVEPLNANAFAQNPDFDGDGLSDLEELLIGTNPTHWDTDGDHMCDGWEVMMGLDPINGGRAENPDGDFMAFYVTDGVPCIRQEDGTIVVAPNLVEDVDYDAETMRLLREVKFDSFSFKPKMVADEDGVEHPLTYGFESDAAIQNAGGMGYGYAMVDEITTNSFEFAIGTEVTTDAEYVLIHDQVRDAFGFDPRTAWFSTATGYVANRWDPGINADLESGDESGRAVNTRAYNNYDEYLVMKYRQDYQIGYAPNERHYEQVWDEIRNKTTIPTVILAPVADDDDEEGEGEEGAQAGDRTALDISNAVADAFQAAGSNKTPVTGHGADTDGDGVPDGWELYMYRDPNVVPGDGETGLGERGANDFDGDGLPWSYEYAGTDSCNAYQGCASIYQNHPGIRQGWYNKFFPTNPGTLLVNDPVEKWAGNDDGRDTDGDGVNDFDEGSSWSQDFYNGGQSFETRLSFIYGTPTDDDSCCIRGGGMNPCSVDTDLDGIPDGWEMQHAGAAVDASTMVPLAEGVEIGVTTFIADGLINPRLAGDEEGDGEGEEEPEANTIYLAGGMDATWPGDAITDPSAGGKSFDNRINRNRDVDFDHDGLQNYQEYLVQSVRHFRWDDISTPLMGRVLGGTDGNWTQKFYGYVPFDSADAETFAGLALVTWGADAAELIHDRVTEGDWNEDGWRKLGYLAAPVHAWDRAVTSGTFEEPVYMLPVTGRIISDKKCAGYISTDPRMADTDGDGMDDFYEMFHGLNPILGTDPSTPETNPATINTPNWEGGKKGDIIAAVYSLMTEVDTLATYNAYYNPWIYPTFNLEQALTGAPPCAFEPIAAPQAFDPVLYPWIMGAPQTDADGDGLRNIQEAIQANVTPPMPLHSDPTPLWFTERTTPGSFVGQYYLTSNRLKGMVGDTWSLDGNDLLEIAALEGGNDFTYMFSFEENEGYDTDNDMVPDSREVATTATRASDILRFDDPGRRQALWLNGVDAFAMTTEGQYRPYRAHDLLKQFTVECWVRPELTGADQTIIERSSLYEGSALNKDAKAIRANFRIGLAADGRVYGMFDNDDALESGSNYPISCQRVYGTELPMNEWSHVALSYDGKELAIYVNGGLIRSSRTSLIPATGVRTTLQNMGATNALTDVVYTYNKTGLFVGARPQKKAERALPELTADLAEMTLADFREFFKGYVDEVRVWDGARDGVAIRNDYLRRYTFADASANRDAVYAVWCPDENGQNGTRNETDGLRNLPPELLYHYSFSTLAGAVKPEDVAKTPIGFTANVIGAAMNDYASNEDISTEGLYVDTDLSLKGGPLGEVAGGLTVGWWEKCQTKSTVYDDYHVVPWIENTVAHLPMIDGGCVDTLLYNETVGGGYMPAWVLGIEKYDFANTAIPYASATYNLDRFQRLAVARRASEVLGGAAGELYDRYSFHIRSKFIGSSDMVPMGGAYAKSCTELWDGAASDMWEYTATDDDADGLPDWWEEYARNNYCDNLDPALPLNWDTLVTYRGMEMTASQAYLIDIALGLQPDGTINSDYASTADADHNGIPDWWEKIFGVDGEDMYADSDNDGLPNYAEYLLSFVFDLGHIFDPANPYSVNDYEIDYFFPIGSLYAGEIFTDNDMMEDQWEAKYGTGYVNPFIWDANSDKDEDGWSAFAECRYSNFTAQIMADKTSHVLGEAEMKDYPIPTLKLSLRYNQSQQIAGGGNGGNGGNDNDNDGDENSLAPLVIKTYTAKANNTQSENVVPDAVFNVRPGETVERTFYLGAFAKRIVRGTLTPGYVDSSSFDMEFYPLPQNENYTWTYTDDNDEVHFLGGTYEDYMKAYNLYGSEAIKLTSANPEWTSFSDQGAFTITRDGETEKGYICFQGQRAGEINLTTGEFSFDMSLCENWIIEREQQEDDQPLADGEEPSRVNVAASVFRFNYRSRIPVLQQKKLDLYLGMPNTGSVREGKNRIEVFYDIDGNGAYTPGEPLGFADDVDVSWHQGAAEIELTDTTPIITRMALQQDGEGGGVASDRFILYGSEDGDYRALVAGELAGGDYQRIRVVRTLVNGYSIVQLGIPNRVVVDKWIHLGQRPYIYEGDVLSDGEFDLDWATFSTEVLGNKNVANNKFDITNVVYRIVLGNGTVDATATNNLFQVATVRHFDPTVDRKVPTLVSPGVGGESIVYGSRPTFRWSMNGYNSYTAFKLQILDGAKVVWDSGVRRAPATDANGNYIFTPDVYVGDLLESGKTYSWRVSMYNAKFRTDAWSTNVQSFVMNATAIGYGAIDVCAKYFGPATGTVLVEAYTTPDFTGLPVARAKVTDTASVSEYGVMHQANAKLLGLPAGTYYIRAFLDANGNRTRESWESWGYACPRELSEQMFNPTAVVISPSATAGQVIVVYIEDVDQNANNLPDAWEMAKGGKLDAGASNVTDVLSGGIVVNNALSALIEREGATVPNGMAAQILGTLSLAPVQALIFGVDVPEGGSVAAAVADATEVVDGSVAITGAAFDREAKKVTLTVEADVANAYANTLAGALYTFDTTSAQVTCVVWRKASLAEAGWTQVAAKKVTVGREAAKVEVDLSGVDFAEGGFYKVTLEK